jgi:hypothetical protein
LVEFSRYKKKKSVSYAKFSSRAVIYKTGLVEGMPRVSRAIGGILRVISIEFSTGIKIVTALLSIS